MKFATASADDILGCINLLDRELRSERDVVFGVTHSSHNMKPGDPMHTLQYLWAVEGDWKLLVRYKGEDSTRYHVLHSWDTAPAHLYNLKNDPHENKDLADQHPEIVERLKRRIEAWRKL